MQRWLERQVRTLLGCAHHHVIFTIPHELNVLWLCNYRVLGDLLFRASRDALFALCSDPRYMGALPGLIAALHTWGQQLHLHPHTHCLLTAGGVDESGRWVPSRRRAVLPAEPLKRLFRAKFLYGVRGLAMKNQLRLPDGWTKRDVLALCRTAESKRWNVWLCERYEDATAVLNYLGRYLHGGPINESRLLAFDGERVSFRYKNYRMKGPDGPAQKVTSLGKEEFVRRYLQHIPPKGFHMVRAYGIYRPGGNTKALRRELRLALPVPPALHDAITLRSLPRADEDAQILECPTCGSRNLYISICPRARAGPLQFVA